MHTSPLSSPAHSMRLPDSELTHTLPSPLTRSSASFADCAVANDYNSAPGTWGDSCEAAFEDATDDCLAPASQYTDKSSFPAHVRAGYITKAGSIDAYLGVPESNKNVKVSTVGRRTTAQGGGGQPSCTTSPPSITLFPFWRVLSGGRPELQGMQQLLEEALSVLRDARRGERRPGD